MKFEKLIEDFLRKYDERVEMVFQKLPVGLEKSKFSRFEVTSKKKLIELINTHHVDDDSKPLIKNIQPYLSILERVWQRWQRGNNNKSFN